MFRSEAVSSFTVSSSISKSDFYKRCQRGNGYCAIRFGTEELEDFWPAAHYDIPVTGDWDVDELQVIRDGKDYAIRNEFELIINHSGIIIQIPTIKVLDTRLGESAGSANSINRLEAIQQASKEYQLRNPKESTIALRNSSQPPFSTWY